MDSDKKLGKVYIDITESDANELMYEERDFDWCFPVYDKNNKRVGYVDVAIGRTITEPETEMLEEVVRLAGDGEGRLKGEN
jgi:hypothetical protein